MIRRPPRSTLDRSSAASDVYKRQVLPIASGYRLALIFNLIRVDEGPLPQAPDYGAQQTQLTRLLAEWDRSGSLPDKLVYPLEHAYTEAEIGFSALKGQDSACLLYTSDAADERSSVDLGGRRIIKKKTKS